MFGWGILGVGILLVWAGVTGRSPGDVAKAVLANEPLPPKSKLTVKSGVSVGPDNGTWFGGLSGTSDEPHKDGVINVALQQMGKPYEWGAEGPDKFDCSGLTQYSYRLGAGKAIPRVSAAQYAFSKPTSSPSNGDLVFLGHPTYHVGLYYGGKYINAPDVGQTVKISPIPRGAYYGKV